MKKLLSAGSKGASTLEYVLIACLIVVLCIGVFRVTGSKNGCRFDKAGLALANMAISELYNSACDSSGEAPQNRGSYPGNY